MFTGNRFLPSILIAAFVLFSTSAMAQVATSGGSGLLSLDAARTMGDKNFAVGLFQSMGEYAGKTVDPKETVLVPSITVGLSDNFEISVTMPSAKIEPDDADEITGAADGLAKFKLKFFESEDGHTTASVIGQLTIPSGDKDKGLGTGDSDFGVKLAIDRNYDGVFGHINIGVLDHKNENVDSIATYGAGLEWFIADNMSVIAEVTGQAAWSDTIAWRKSHISGGAGVRYYFDDWGSVTAGYHSRASSDRETPHYMWTVGVAIGIGAGKPTFEPRSVAADAPAPEPVAAPAPEPVPAPVAAPVAAPEPVKLSAVHFKFDSAALEPKAKEILAANASKAREMNFAKMLVLGHTCSIGPEGYNYKLGLKRANAARDYLAKELGINPDQLSVESLGEKEPAYSNDTRDGRSKNRRVEFVIELK